MEFEEHGMVGEDTALNGDEGQICNPYSLG